MRFDPFSMVVSTLFLSAQLLVNAQLLVAKTYGKEHIVQGEELAVQYAFYNEGDERIANVELSDDSFSQSFVVPSNAFPIKIQNIDS